MVSNDSKRHRFDASPFFRGVTVASFRSRPRKRVTVFSAANEPAFFRWNGAESELAALFHAVERSPLSARSPWQQCDKLDFSGGRLD
jgi:hypothetical protein